MIHYHGTPITPDKAAVEILAGRHGLVSFACTRQIELVADVCQSFVLDNGAFTIWKQGISVDWDAYYRFVDDWRRHPGFDWALVPDTIEGTEEDNDRLLEVWPLGAAGVPVWHYHESVERLVRLSQTYPRVALGSSGDYATPGAPAWWARTREVLPHICTDGRPNVKLHGLRMLDPRIFTKLPFSSADSTNIGRNIGSDLRWSKAAYPPGTKGARGCVLASRIESHQSAAIWRSL